MHVLIAVTRKLRGREAPRRKGKGKDLEDRRCSRRRTCAGCICQPWCKPPCLQGESVCVLTDSALRPTGHSFEKTINVARAREGFENGGGATSRRSSLHSSLISPPRSLVGSSATEVSTFYYDHLVWSSLPSYGRKHLLEVKRNEKPPTFGYPRF